MSYFTRWLLTILIALAACTMKDTEDKKTPSHNDLKGPAAKNTPVQQRRAAPLIVREPTSAKKRWGGAVKNILPWHKQEGQRYQQLVQQRKQKLKGPRAKNRRPK